MIRSRGMRIKDQHYLRLTRLVRLSRHHQYEFLGLMIDEMYARTARSPRHQAALAAMEQEDNEAIARGEDPTTPRPRRRGEVIRLPEHDAIELRRRAMEMTDDPGQAEDIALEVLRKFLYG